MRNIDAGLLAQLRAGHAIVLGLVQLTIDGTDYRYTEADVPVLVEGNLYEPREFSIGNVVLSSDRIVDTCTLTLVNLDQALSLPFLDGEPQGSSVVVRVAAFDSQTRQHIAGAVAAVFTGSIDDWTMGEESIEITLASELTQWRRDVGRAHAASCPWRVFGGDQCRYSGGETWCDRSYARCSALGNTNNFGGYRWLPSLENKSVTWGQPA